MMTLEEKLKNLPARPGVYLMKDGKGRVIYVGKAKNLRNRVRSYFQKGFEPDPRRVAMVGRIADFETVVTGSELEAFVLESNLIKKHKPRFNVVLKDDKNYPYLKLTVNDEFPMLTVVRKLLKDGALYFGPYVPTSPMWDILRFINRQFPIRKCRKKITRDKLERPCLQYGMGRCLGPCGGRVSVREYGKTVDEVRLFLIGKGEALAGRLRKKMEAASKAMDFELAARLRDRVAAIDKAAAYQRVVSPGLEDRDVIALAMEGAAADVQVLFIRGGRLLGRKEFFISGDVETTAGELLGEFINRFYTGGKEVPPEVLVSDEIEDEDTTESCLGGLRGGAVRLSVPKRGSRKKIMDMARDNARVSLQQNINTESGRVLLLESLRSELGLKRLPRRIEAFDISNISGRDAVGSMVSFTDTVADKSDYRHFRINQVEGPDDFGMMREVVSRRYRRVMEGGPAGKDGMPDLIMVDGGKGQLSAAISALRELGADFDGFDIIGLAKARERGMKYEGVGEARAFERVFGVGDREPRILAPTSAAVNLLARIRDESHRFAITHHRKLRAKKSIASELDEIPGIGKVRKSQLLKHFGSLAALRRASLEEIAALHGIPKNVAESIVEKLADKGSK